jgi:hypothetical protein
VFPRLRDSVDKSVYYWFTHPLFVVVPCIAALVGCTNSRDVALEEFVRWQDNAHGQAKAGMLRWSELYKQSFDRLTAMPSSIQQDTRLENTVLLLSTALKFEANEMSPQQFAAEREYIEENLQARLR